VPAAARGTLSAVGLFRKRPRLRALDEHECYLRLHGRRSGDVEVVEARTTPPARAEPATPPRSEPEAPSAPLARHGPTDDVPALHLVIAYPRSGSRLTGEQVRRELLRRMEARAGEAA
jgi:hypothetical protein